MAEKDSSVLRELVRKLIRHLGILEKSDACCCGISLTQCHALVEIGRKGNINLNELADILNVDKSTMSRTINNLVESGLVVRAMDDDDRRYVAIQLSERGVHLFRNTEAAMEDYFHAVLNHIPADKREQVLQSLILLTEAIGLDQCCQRDAIR